MSSGAVLALEAAAHGLAIRKLALYEAPFNLDDNARPISEDYTKQLTALLAQDRRGDAVALAMTTFGAPAEAVAGMRHAPFWATFESVATTLAYDNAIMGNGSIPIEWLASVTVPTLVIDGGASPASMHNAAQQVADALPNAQRRTLEGQTHEVSPGNSRACTGCLFRRLEVARTSRSARLLSITPIDPAEANSTASERNTPSGVSERLTT